MPVIRQHLPLCRFSVRSPAARRLVKQSAFHLNTDLLSNTESEYDEYDLVSRSLLGWKFVDLTALLSRQMLKKFNIELNHC